MELHVDLDSLVVRLLDPEVLTEFSVVVDAPPGATPASHGHRLGDVVAHRHVGAVEASGEVAVDQGIIRFLAAGEVGDGWEVAFDEMLAVARAEGWLDVEGRIRGHVVWPRG